MDNDNKLTSFKVINLNHKKIYIPLNGYCMYTKNICSHYELNKDLKIGKIGYYRYFYKSF